MAKLALLGHFADVSPSLYCSVCGTYGIWNPESRMRYSQLFQMSPVGAYCIVLSFFLLAEAKFALQ